MVALQASDKYSHTARMLRFLDRPDALPLNLIRRFETTSKKEIKFIEPRKG